ncbi:hypothetical protein, partial [Enterobacter hormaechei]|uniref:hypothetical protein n=1 Tax=Enterobacter hormaechei TaxID=158836 RepID=UPI003F526D9A
RAAYRPEPAARRRALGIVGKDVPAMQSAETVVLAAGSQQPWVGSSLGGVRRRHTDSLSRTGEQGRKEADKCVPEGMITSLKMEKC